MDVEASLVWQVLIHPDAACWARISFSDLHLKQFRRCSFGLSACKNTHTHTDNRIHPHTHTHTHLNAGRHAVLPACPPGLPRVSVMENRKRVVALPLNLLHLYLPPDVCRSLSSAPQHLHFPNTPRKIRDLRNKHRGLALPRLGEKRKGEESAGVSITEAAWLAAGASLTGRRQRVLVVANTSAVLSNQHHITAGWLFSISSV